MLTPVNPEDLAKLEKEKNLHVLKQSTSKSKEKYDNQIEETKEDIKLAEAEALQFTQLLSGSSGPDHDDISPLLREGAAMQLR